MAVEQLARGAQVPLTSSLILLSSEPHALWFESPFDYKPLEWLYIL